MGDPRRGPDRHPGYGDVHLRSEDDHPHLPRRGPTTGQGNLSGTELQPILAEKELLVERATTFEQYKDNPAAVPVEMRDGRWYIAWGDIVRDYDGGLRVRGFLWFGGQPVLGWSYVDNGFNADYPALLAS